MGSRKRGLFRPLFFLGFSNASASRWLNVNILSPLTVWCEDRDEDPDKIKIEEALAKHGDQLSLKLAAINS